MFDVTVTNIKTNETKVYRPLGFLEDAAGAVLEAFMNTVDALSGMQTVENDDDPWIKEQIRRAEMRMRKDAEQ